VLQVEVSGRLPSPPAVAAASLHLVGSLNNKAQVAEGSEALEGGLLHLPLLVEEDLVV